MDIKHQIGKSFLQMGREGGQNTSHSLPIWSSPFSPHCYDCFHIQLSLCHPADLPLKVLDEIYNVRSKEIFLSRYSSLLTPLETH